MPNVTVLMSVYNGLPYLSKAVESICEQTYKNFEFLIIDDASTDGSRLILEERARQDDRIRLITHKKNRGLGYSLHEGVREAKGKRVARMDDDDVSLQARLEKQMSYLAANPQVDVLGGWAIECDENEAPMRIRRCPTSHDKIVDLVWAIPFIHPTVVFKRDAILEAGSYDSDLRRRQDYDLWFRCVDAGLRFANLPEPLIKYRFTDDYYKKNNLEVAIDQVKIGWRGCRLVGAGPIAYAGVLAPLVRAILPRKLSMVMQKLLNEFDPRNQEHKPVKAGLKKHLSDDVER